ncbi:amidohydrolase family protein [Saccharopolyspora spinosa]|uniref:TIM-barrel fold metal-dependent hydrolase n=1 Tax=Saccharopolyspora spinosa TaxID=60894 RepID=A0A2N3Y6T5_SACSN|nr:amidohydrolase family protein [Saccharopolyspora spinosa]PKW18578.1 putative TIM-barrel fold metal-dependent hydrolase [Saccharopolyspora spinosa]
MTAVAQEPGTNPPIVDCDVHPLIKNVGDVLPYLSPSARRRFETRGIRTYARARDRYNHPNRTYRIDALPESGGPAGSDREFTLTHHIAPYGIATALLLPQEPYGVTAWGDAEAAAAFCSAANAYFLDTWVAHDDRYALAITIAPHDPYAAADEIRRRGRETGVVGIQLLLREQMLGSRWFDPVYEAACELELPIVLHQSGSEGCYVTSQTVAGGVPRSYGERHAVLTQVGAANVVDMIAGGALERFPTLRIVMVEWGFSWLSSLLARMDHLWERDPSAAPLVRRRPSEYVAEHFTFTTQPLDEPETATELRSLFTIPHIGEMLLFSSDYPHYDTDDPGFILKRIPADMRDRVCYQNAVATFGAKILRSVKGTAA